MVSTLEQIREGAAPADVAGLYRDIRRCLRTTYVPLPFRVLAAHRGALRAVWEQLRPNVLTRAFEEQAGDLRAALAKAAVDMGTPLIETVLAADGVDLDDLDEAREQIDLFHYTDPKVLLCLSALQEVIAGGTVGGRHLPARLLAIVPGPDESMPALALVPEDPGGVPGEILHDLTRATRLPVAEVELRALCRWPDLLTEAWVHLEPVLNDPRERTAMMDVRERARRLAGFFPYVIDPSMGLLRDAPEAQAAIERVVDVCSEPACRLALFVSALKVSLDGPEDALDTQYSVTWDELPIDQVELT